MRAITIKNKVTGITHRMTWNDFVQGFGQERADRIMSNLDEKWMVLP